MARKPTTEFDAKAFLTMASTGRSVSTYRKKQILFAQGDPADAVFYVDRGQIKLAVVSERGKSAVVAMRGGGDFVCERSLAGQLASMVSPSVKPQVPLGRIAIHVIVLLLHVQALFSHCVIT